MLCHQFLVETNALIKMYAPFQGQSGGRSQWDRRWFPLPSCLCLRSPAWSLTDVCAHGSVFPRKSITHTEQAAGGRPRTSGPCLGFLSNGGGHGCSRPGRGENTGHAEHAHWGQGPAQQSSVEARTLGRGYLGRCGSWGVQGGGAVPRPLSSQGNRSEELVPRWPRREG